jgi:hypothetical protein
MQGMQGRRGLEQRQSLRPRLRLRPRLKQKQARDRDKGEHCNVQVLVHERINKGIERINVIITATADAVSRLLQLQHVSSTQFEIAMRVQPH